MGIIKEVDGGFTSKPQKCCKDVNEDAADSEVYMEPYCPILQKRVGVTTNLQGKSIDL